GSDCVISIVGCAQGCGERQLISCLDSRTIAKILADESRRLAETVGASHGQVVVIEGCSINLSVIRVRDKELIGRGAGGCRRRCGRESRSWRSAVLSCDIQKRRDFCGISDQGVGRSIVVKVTSR